MSTTDRALTRQERSLEAIENFELVAAEVDGLATKLECTSAKRMFILADAMNRLDAALTPEVMMPVMNLMGSRVGFRTDKDKEEKHKQYTIGQVKEVVKEAILYGAHMTGNEVNIISGGMYCTKEHFQRKVRELPGLTGLEATVGTPVITNGEAKVRCSARWRMNGVEQSLGFDDKMPCVFAIRVYDRPGGHSVATDQAIGKATRKLYKRIYEMATGSALSIPDGEAVDDAREVDINEAEPEAKGATEKLKDKMKARSQSPSEQAPQSTMPTSEPSHEFKQAYAKLSAMYDERGAEIDDMLRMNGVDMALMDIPKDCGDERIVREVIRIAAEL